MGPADGPTDKPTGRRLPMGGSTASPVIAHASLYCSTTRWNRLAGLITRNDDDVDIMTTPTVIVPSPAGYIHPWPVIGVPDRSRRSSTSSIADEACRSDGKDPWWASP